MFVVIGYGSRVRGDDGIGQILAQSLIERLPSVEVITQTQLTPELAETISRAALVFFLDAGTHGQPGTLSCQWIKAAGVEGVFTHNVTPQSLLTMAHTLYGKMPDAMLMTIHGMRFDYNTDLSPEMRAFLPGLSITVENLIKHAVDTLMSTDNQEQPSCMNLES